MLLGSPAAARCIVAASTLWRLMLGVAGTGLTIGVRIVCGVPVINIIEPLSENNSLCNLLLTYDIIRLLKYRVS